MAASPDDIAPFAYSFHVPRDPRAVGVARASLRAALLAHEVPELLDRAELLASEMLTNALVHATGDTGLRLKWARETLRMTVWDTSPKPPEVGWPPDQDSESGRGLHLLRELADRWNHTPLTATLCDQAAKIIWCEIGRTPPPGW